MQRELTKRECDQLANELARLHDDLGDKMDYLCGFLNRQHPDAETLINEIWYAREKAGDYYESWLDDYYTVTSYERKSEWVRKTRRKWETLIGK